MRRRYLFWLTCAFLSSNPVVASAVEIHNTTDYEVAVAFGSYYPGVSQIGSSVPSSWKSHGWYLIPPRGSRDFPQEKKGSYMFAGIKVDATWSHAAPAGTARAEPFFYSERAFDDVLRAFSISDVEIREGGQLLEYYQLDAFYNKRYDRYEVQFLPAAQSFFWQPKENELIDGEQTSRYSIDEKGRCYEAGTLLGQALLDQDKHGRFWSYQIQRGSRIYRRLDSDVTKILRGGTI